MTDKPIPADEAAGYQNAFYEIVALLDMPAMAMSPRRAWETEMRPKIKALAAAGRDREVAIRWANRSIEMLQAAFFPLADALRNLEKYLSDTPHHNVMEAAAARKALAAFDEARDDFRLPAKEVKFLLERLEEFERSITSEEDAREWHGHVAPAIARVHSSYPMPAR